MGCSANDPDPFALSLSKGQAGTHPRLTEARAEFSVISAKVGGFLLPGTPRAAGITSVDRRVQPRFRFVRSGR
jgi:hypothetical protein